MIPKVVPLQIVDLLKHLFGATLLINLVAKCHVIRNLDFWLRIAQTTYTEREVLKSGWDEIEGNTMTEIKLQLRYKF